MFVSVGVDPRVAGTKSQVVDLCGCDPTTALSSLVLATLKGLTTEMDWIVTTAPAATRKTRMSWRYSNKCD
jgi:hypothetical protein